MFAHQHAGVVPDIMTLAKPLGGGLPMGAILLRDSLAHHLQVGDHGSTFGGNPVAAAASLAVLDRLESAGFLETVAKNGEALMRGLRKLARAHKKAIAEVRGMGLMVGVEFHGEAGPVLKGLREKRVLATKTGDKVLRLLPPLVVKRADVKAFLAALSSVLESGAGLPA
jgi:acetylornithine/succinyldiaminopimelate/putrescine aminotransferase